ncbi:MAG: hypothetical protein JST16_11820 [Bdellovibrionales bacterium]|nr:hypothetical protein [Bdellovibrionales bacterium]
MKKIFLSLLGLAGAAHAANIEGAWSTGCTTYQSRSDSAIFREVFQNGQWTDIMDYYEDSFCQKFQTRYQTTSDYTTKDFTNEVRALDYVDGGGNLHYSAYRIESVNGTDQLYLSSTSSSQESDRPTEANAGPLVRVAN